MVVWRKPPSSSPLSSLADMQMDDDLPVRLNVYISMFKQWWQVQNILSVPSFRHDGYAQIQLLTVAIDESLGDSIQRGREGVGEVTRTNK